jgi:hypothetical protein
MKKYKGIIGLLVLLGLPVIGFSQTATSLYEPIEWNHSKEFTLNYYKTTPEPISKIAVSLNPTGFVQFGPVFNAEFRISEDIVLNTHIRASVLGMLTYEVKNHPDGLDDLGAMAYGGGIIKFFGEKKNKPYAGILFEYEHATTTYAQYEQWEWSQTDLALVFIFNGGYRFRFDGGIFINTGAYLGAATGVYEWEFADASYGTNDSTPRIGTTLKPFGMLEVSLGIEF